MNCFQITFCQINFIIKNEKLNLKNQVLFYFIADWRFILLLVLSGLFNFFVAKLNFNKKEFQIRKYIFYFAILFNVGILLYFKYFNRETWMFIIIIGSVFGQISYLLLENNDASR